MLSKSAQSVLWLVGVNKPCDRIYQSMSLSLLVQGFLKEQFVPLANPKAFSLCPKQIVLNSSKNKHGRKQVNSVLLQSALYPIHQIASH